MNMHKHTETGAGQGQFVTAVTIWLK